MAFLGVGYWLCRKQYLADIVMFCDTDSLRSWLHSWIVSYFIEVHPDHLINVLFFKSSAEWILLELIFQMILKTLQKKRELPHACFGRS